MPFLSLADNLLQDNHFILQESVDDFEIRHKTSLISVWGTFPP